MSKSSPQLYFDYPSTAKIRIKKQNCFYNEYFPAVYRIKTQKLDFLIPKAAVIFSERYVFIPLSEYRKILTSYYKSINYGY